MSKLNDLLSNQDRHWDELSRLAKAVAQNAGWKLRGSVYAHAEHECVPVREIDGWFDLCGISGLELEDHEDEIKHLLIAAQPGENPTACGVSALSTSSLNPSPPKSNQSEG